jgi:nucleoside-diphosphate-sugar epimerase
MARHVLVAGCGWLGTAVARRLLAGGARVSGIRRDPGRADALRSLGVEPVVLDLATAAPHDLPPCDAIIACQSASSDAPDAYRAAYVRANATLLEAAARAGARLVYTGSTGVFGQRRGEDVTEETPPAPAGATGEVLVEAEALVRGRGGVVVRLSGLYGPGRAGILDRVSTGKLALGAGEGAFMNFCHQEDAASFVVAALDRGAPGAVYHGSDAEPATRREVVEWIAARLAITPRRTDATPPGPDRRIRSDRTRAALGVTLAFPSFREGLVPLLAASAPGQSG